MDGAESTTGSTIGIENSKLLERSLSAWTARQVNELHVPLLRLPQEITRMIIRLAATYQPEPHYTAYAIFRIHDCPRTRAIPWLHLGHICNKLRETLLGMRGLWAEEACAYERLHITREIVRRAAGTPLDIAILHDSIPDDLVEFLLPYLDNARSIEIASTRVLFKILEKFDGLRLHIAENLVLDNRSMAYRANDSRDMTSPTDEFTLGSLAQRSFDWILTGSVIPMITPCLRSLHLLNIIVPFDPSYLHELRLQLPESDAPEWSGYILDTLCLCSSLHVLDIGGMEFPPESIIASPISLPLLADVAMRGDTACVSWLWSQVSVPFGAKVRVDIDGDLDHPEVWEFISALARHVLHASDAHPISGFAFLLEPTGYLLHFKLYAHTEDPLAETKEHRFNPLHRGHHCTLNVQVACDIDIVSLKNHLTRLRDLFGLAAVEHLTIGTLDRYDETGESAVDYGQWLSAFRDVRNLCLSHYPSPAPDYCLLYPHLRSLVLLHVLRKEDELDKVAKMVEERATHGIAFAELKIAFDDTETPDTNGNPDLRLFKSTLRKFVPLVEFESLNES
ncbi:hypothetical protein PENSPDRAFT_748848 [Peniophora sp. CONT]|nr:hypothetical protein PENSPDRAFT_748848 [Peniophora sp. CONT]